MQSYFLDNTISFIYLIIKGVIMKSYFFRSIIIFSAFITVLSCTSPNDSNPIIDQSESYIPLYKGIEKEFISYEDSLQFFTEVVGEVLREDGQKLFIKKLDHFVINLNLILIFGQQIFTIITKMVFKSNQI